MMRVAAVGVLTGWGEGAAALPDDAGRAASGRRVIGLGRPAIAGDRFRRATRECLLGVAAVEAMLRDGGLAREAIGGSRTALVYVTAAAYGASNRAFIVAGAASPARAVGAGAASPARAVGGLFQKDGGSVAGTLHFPYTAPSAVPAEVAIEFGLTGPYVILLGGAAATIDGLWQAGTLLERDRCDRALVLAVETFEECADLWERGHWLLRPPLVEAAACALLAPGGERAAYGSAREASPLEAAVERRAGRTLACAPLIALSLARAARLERAPVTGEWRGRRAALTLEGLAQAATA